MPAGQKGQSDSEMAARLRNDNYHGPDGVRRRKTARFRAFMRQLGDSGSVRVNVRG